MTDSSEDSALNSNLILLIQASAQQRDLDENNFKFQSDSINTIAAKFATTIQIPLNSNLILLIP